MLFDQARDHAACSSRCASSPLVGVDVGQAEDGRWWVIETNDPQFMGLSQLAPLTLWNRLFRALHPRAA